MLPVYRVEQPAGAQPVPTGVPPIAPHPYHILIIDPRPTPFDGIVRVLGFDADQPIPAAQARLNADDLLALDFAKPYHKTLEDALYGLEFVDYAERPLRFDRYSEADQVRIANRMLAVLRAARAGDPLQTPPLAVQPLALDAALHELERLR